MTIDTGAVKADDLFPTDTTGLAQATPPAEARLRDGERFQLRIAPVANRIGDHVLRMLAYNGSIPGPTLHVGQGSEIVVEVTNEGDVEATVHWHGLRLENRYDGVPHETQAPIPIGGTFTYRLQFPDPGFYWYHPHIREDFGLEMGLYGTIVVEPGDASYWPAVDRQLTVTLDDLLVEDGHIAPFRKSGPTYTAMGRYGNVMVTNGQTRFSAQATVGEVVRLYLVNTANTRIFNVALPGARMKVVGGDSGRYERETFVEEVLLAPSERAVVDVLFDTAGDVRLEHRTPDHTYVLGAFWVAGTSTSDSAAGYDTLRTDAELTATRKTIGDDLGREPDKVLGFTALMPLLYGGDLPPASSFACPMHPDVTALEAGTCPRCGMQLIALEPPQAAASSYACPMHPEVTGSAPEICPKCGMKLVPSAAATSPVDSHGHEGDAHHDASGGDGLEWEDLMPDINRRTDPTNMIWKLVDRQTGAENGAITWAFTVGDRVKIRLVNEMEGSEHPMHHPFHVHGAGRFLVLAREGVPEPNLVWKDTVLVPAGHTVDILLDVSNPGLWMAHCHIAEHAQSGMMFSFDVARRPGEAEA
ncbi:MAG TPA: multicopper oxidase family protein [Acidimicrobiales bacterium]|nr:multicopper oxidase family protein [Acidimicrobiales bacterium]